jgi:tetratricopeptide (TPR) repeat protein
MVREFACITVLLIAATWAPTAASHGGIPKEIAALDVKLAGDSERADWWVERATLERLRGDYGAALADLNEAADLEPDLPTLCLERGRVLAIFGYNAEAESDLDYFLATSPRHARALADRAAIRAALGHDDLARADYEAALAIGKSIDVYLALGKLLERGDKLDDAAQCYSKGLGVLSDAVVLKLALIRVETERRNYKRAIQLVDTIIASSAVRADGLLHRAEILEKAGKEAEARRDRLAALEEVNRAMKKRPSALRRLTRAKILLALDRHEEGIDELESVNEQAPNLEEARELLRSARD